MQLMMNAPPCSFSCNPTLILIFCAPRNDTARSCGRSVCRQQTTPVNPRDFDCVAAVSKSRPRTTNSSRSAENPATWRARFTSAFQINSHADLQLFQSIGLATPKSVNDNSIGSGDLSIVLFAEQ